MGDMSKNMIKVFDPNLLWQFGENSYTCKYELEPDTFVYTYASINSPLPMTPHNRYFFPHNLYKYLYVVERPALPDLHRKKSSNWFPPDFICKRGVLGDILAPLGPKAKVIVDHQFNALFEHTGRQRGGLAIIVPK